MREFEQEEQGAMMMSFSSMIAVKVQKTGEKRPKKVGPVEVSDTK